MRGIKATIEPLQTSDGGAGIQENLVTRNGDVEKELGKMRMLLARVAGRVGQLPDIDSEGEAAGANGIADIGKARKRQIDEFLLDSGVFPS